MKKHKQQTQKEVVFGIVKRAGKRGIITPVVMERALKQYIGDAPRRLRELQEIDAVEGIKMEGTRVKTWVACL